MPAQPFTVHVDPDDLARQDLAAAVHLPTVSRRRRHRPGGAAATSATAPGTRRWPRGSVPSRSGPAAPRVRLGPLLRLPPQLGAKP